MTPNDLIKDTLSLLLEIKNKLDSKNPLICTWSSTVHNPNMVSITFIDTNGNYIYGRITDFNPPNLPPISLDDAIELEIYVQNNYAILDRIQKMKAFI